MMRCWAGVLWRCWTVYHGFMLGWCEKKGNLVSWPLGVLSKPIKKQKLEYERGARHGGGKILE